MDLIKKNLVDAYNKKASDRESAKLPKWKQDERELFFEHIKSESKKNLLEIGAGPGKDGLFFKKNGLDTFCIDISLEMIKLCRNKGLNAEVMSFEKMKFEDNHFDSVWAMNCLLHIPKHDIKNVLNEIKRALKPSGLFYMGVYDGKNSEGIWEKDIYEPPRFFSFFKNESLKELVSEIFTIESFRVVPAEIVGGDLDFQSLILRKS